MTRLLFSLTMLLGLFGLFAPRLALAAPEPVSLEDAYIPTHFDDDDIVEFAVAGRFSSTCWRVAGYDRRVELQRHAVQLRQHATRTDEPCLRMLQPFAQVVTLGVLPMGRYQVVDATSGDTLGEVVVDKANHATEPRYAVIHEVTVSASERTVRIRGEIGDRCSELDDVVVTYDGSTILVEPRLRNARLDCTPDNVITFDRTLKLRPTLRGGHLVQVRTRGGAPISRFVIFE